LPTVYRQGKDEFPVRSGGGANGFSIGFPQFAPSLPVLASYLFSAYLPIEDIQLTELDCTAGIQVGPGLSIARKAG
jgi:hypothetical protein